MRFDWESPGRLLLVFAVGLHVVTVRLSCDVCVVLALANITVWAGDAPTGGTRCQCWVHCPTGDRSVPPIPLSQADIWPVQQQVPPEPQLQRRHQKLREHPDISSHGGDSSGDRTPELQPSSQKYVSFPSSPTKERSLVTSWAEDKQVQVLSTVPCPGGTSLCASDRRSGIWFSTKYSGGLAQGVAGKEMRNRASTCLKHISSALSHMHFWFFFLLASPSPLIKLQLCWKLMDVSEKESKVTLSSFVQGLCLFSISGTGFGRNIHEKPQYKPTITGLTTNEWFNTWQSQMAGSEEVLYCVLNNLKPLTVAISNLLS